MITKRLLIAQAVLLAGCSLIFLLPSVQNQTPSGVNLQLPSIMGEWYGSNAEVTLKERQVLGAETEFARKVYTNGRGDTIFASVVLAGSDMNTSIHRPERCLPAQGWTVAASKTMEVDLGQGHKLPVTRLYNMRQIPLSNGSSRPFYNLNYYWFAGYSDLTASHFTRTWIDIRDRLLKGYNQRWAYVTITANVTSEFEKFGSSEQQIDASIAQFIRELSPHIHKDSLRQ